MARIIILSFFAMILTLVFCAELTGLFRSISGQIEMPKVKIQMQDVPKDFYDNEKSYLQTCCVTEIGVIGNCILDMNGPCMMNVITPAITQLNDMSKEFETSFNEGNYTNTMFKSHKEELAKLAEKLLDADMGIPIMERVEREGSLILMICRDMHSLLSLMMAAQKKVPNNLIEY